MPPFYFAVLLDSGRWKAWVPGDWFDAPMRVGFGRTRDAAALDALRVD